MGSFQDLKLGIAILGYGVIGPEHARAIAANPDVELAAIVDPVPKVAAQAAAEKGVPFFSSLTELLASPSKPDAVVICSPNPTHAAAARELAAAGVHMLIEKPLCTDTTDGKTLVADLRAAEEARGVKALVGHHRRFNPYVQATKKALDAGSLGRVVAVSTLWATRKHEAYFDPEWRRLRTAGPVLTNIVHEVDLFHHFFGPITRVHAEAAPSARGFEVEEGAAVVLRFRSGAVATCVLSDNAPSPYSFESGTGEIPHIAYNGQDCYRIFGTEASLSVPDMTRWSYNGKETKDWSVPLARVQLEVGEGVPLDLQLAHFVRVVRGQDAPSCSPQSGLAALMVCEAIKKSLETEKTVELEQYEV